MSRALRTHYITALCVCVLILKILMATIKNKDRKKDFHDAGLPSPPSQYRTLAANVEFLEGSACTITEAYGLLKNMQFDDDPCAIKNYIKKRLSNSDLETIINCTNLTTDPTSYALLQKAQPTSAAVGRSFSMLTKF